MKIKLHKCVRGHWEVWFTGDSVLDSTKVLRPWIIPAKIKLLFEILVLKVQQRVLNTQHSVLKMRVSDVKRRIWSKRSYARSYEDGMMDAVFNKPYHNQALVLSEGWRGYFDGYTESMELREPR